MSLITLYRFELPRKYRFELPRKILVKHAGMVTTPHLSIGHSQTPVSHDHKYQLFMFPQSIPKFLHHPPMTNLYSCLGLCIVNRINYLFLSGRKKEEEEEKEEKELTFFYYKIFHIEPISMIFGIQQRTQQYHVFTNFLKNPRSSDEVIKFPIFPAQARGVFTHIKGRAALAPRPCWAGRFGALPDLHNYIISANCPLPSHMNRNKSIIKSAY